MAVILPCNICINSNQDMGSKNKTKNKKATDTAAVENEIVDNTANEARAELSEHEKLTTQLAEEKDKFLRLFAEFENYKRRTAKERLELFSTASQEVVVALLPVLDDFDRAINEISKSNDSALLEGVELINSKLITTLEQKGLKPVEVAAGAVFNADIHEAITQIPAQSEDMKGKIIDVVEKGYKLGEKIIRFPKVVIGN